jgi:hypothetical protein
MKTTEQAPMRNVRANECDEEARSATIDGLLGLVMLRQAILTRIERAHPHFSTIEQARDSAVREVKWRFGKAVRCIKKARSALDNLMGDSDLHDGQSLEMTAMAEIAEVLLMEDIYPNEQKSPSNSH